MFDISVKLVAEQDEISNLETIGWEKHSWKYLSLFDDERIINLQRTKVYVFSDAVLCLGKIHQNPESNKAWKERIGWITSSQSYRNFDGIDGEPTEFEWNIFPGFTTLQLYGKVTDLLSRLGETPENFTGRISFMSMFNDISCDRYEERVTPKSRPMMNLIARTPSHVSSSTSVSLGKRSYGSQDPWSSIAKEDRSGRLDNGTDLFEASDHHYHEQLMESFSSASYSKLDDDRAWSSQEWKTEIMTYDRSGRPDKTSW